MCCEMENEQQHTKKGVKQIKLMSLDQPMDNISYSAFWNYVKRDKREKFKL